MFTYLQMMIGMLDFYQNWIPHFEVIILPWMIVVKHALNP